eukprot:TRINITY_DN2176_c3_g1_i1.p1 TRINITY_DN2176_c3_g1~~TRINITY_DN2176_c3_g1_i1.p1  ORF type:complete len:1299 (+),score=455.03 TRINITY_DN2176_c3_g1_i1:129-4025(+)
MQNDLPVFSSPRRSGSVPGEIEAAQTSAALQSARRRVAEFGRVKLGSYGGTSQLLSPAGVEHVSPAYSDRLSHLTVLQTRLESRTPFTPTNSTRPVQALRERAFATTGYPPRQCDHDDSIRLTEQRKSDLQRIQAAERRAAALDEEKATLEIYLRQTKETCKGLQDEIEAQNRRIASLEAATSTYTAHSAMGSPQGITPLDMAHSEVDRYKLLVDELSNTVDEKNGELDTMKRQLANVKLSESVDETIKQLTEKLRALEDELASRPSMQRYKASLIATTNLSEKCKKLEAQRASDLERLQHQQKMLDAHAVAQAHHSQPPLPPRTPTPSPDPLPSVIQLSPTSADNVVSKLRVVEAKCEDYERKQVEAATIHSNQLLQLQTEIIKLKEAASKAAKVHSEATRSLKDEYDTRVSGTYQELISVKQERDELSLRVSHLEHSVRAARESIIVDEVEQPSQELIQLRMDKRAVEDELRAVTEKLEQYQESMKSMREMEAKLSLKESDLRTSRIEVASLQREREFRESAKLDELRHVNAQNFVELEVRLSQAERGLSKMTEDKSHLEDELEETKLQLERALQQLNNNFKKEALANQAAQDLEGVGSDAPDPREREEADAEMENLKREKAHLQSRLDASHQSVAELRKEIADMQTKLHMKESQVKAGAIEIESLQRERDMLSTARITSLTQSNDKTEELHGKLSLAERELERAEQENEALKAKVVDLERKHSEAIEKIKNNFQNESEFVRKGEENAAVSKQLQMALDTAKAEHQRMRRTSLATEETMRAQIQELEKQLEEQEQALQSPKQTTTVSQDTIPMDLHSNGGDHADRDLRERISDLETEKEKLLDEVKYLKELVEDGRTSKDRQRGEFASLESRLNDAHADITDLTELRNKMQAQIEELHEKLKKADVDHEHQITKLQKKKEAAEGRAAAADEKVAFFKMEADNAKEQAKQGDVIIAEVKAEHEEQVRKLKKMIDEVTQERDAEQAEVERLSARLRSSTDTAGVAGKLEDAVKEVAVLKEKLHDAGARIADFQSKVGRLEAENGRLLAVEAKVAQMEYETKAKESPGTEPLVSKGSVVKKEKGGSIKVDVEGVLSVSRQSSMRSISSLSSMRKVESVNYKDGADLRELTRGTVTPGAVSVVQSEQPTIRHIGTPSVDGMNTFDDDYNMDQPTPPPAVDEEPVSTPGHDPEEDPEEEAASLAALQKRETELTDAVEFCYRLLEDLEEMYKEAPDPAAQEESDRYLEIIDEHMPEEREMADEDLSDSMIVRHFAVAGEKLATLADIAKKLMEKVDAVRTD